MLGPAGLDVNTIADESYVFLERCQSYQLSAQTFRKKGHLDKDAVKVIMDSKRTDAAEFQTELYSRHELSV